MPESLFLPLEASTPHRYLGQAAGTKTHFGRPQALQHVNPDDLIWTKWTGRARVSCAIGLTKK